MHNWVVSKHNLPQKLKQTPESALELWLRQSLSAWEHSFETRPGPAGQPELEPGRVEEKTGEEKTRCDPTDPVTWLTRRVDPVTRLQTCWLLLLFLLKRYRFDFFKKTNWPGQNPEPGPGLKTMLESVRLFFEISFI